MGRVSASSQNHREVRRTRLRERAKASACCAPGRAGEDAAARSTSSPPGHKFNSTDTATNYANDDKAGGRSFSTHTQSSFEVNKPITSPILRFPLETATKKNVLRGRKA